MHVLIPKIILLCTMGESPHAHQLFHHVIESESKIPRYRGKIRFYSCLHVLGRAAGYRNHHWRGCTGIELCGVYTMGESSRGRGGTKCNTCNVD